MTGGWGGIRLLIVVVRAAARNVLWIFTDVLVVVAFC